MMPWDNEPEAPADLELSIRRAAVAPEPDGSYRLMLDTTRGMLTGVLHVAEGETGAAVMVSGALGGVDGPAGSIYARLGTALVDRGVTTLRLEYRQPGEFDESLLDVMAALSFLKGVGAERVVLIGHSFGGGVAVRAGSLAPIVCAVAAMSSQLFGTEEAGSLAPRPLLLVHGMDDQVLEATASDIIYNRAHEPKRLVLYAGAGHALDQCKAELYDLLLDWIPEQARPSQGRDG